MRNWDDLRFFLEVAREPSLARAAATLHVNKSTVSRRIAALEAELEVRLVEVRGAGYVLTEEGRRLLARATEFEAQGGRGVRFGGVLGEVLSSTRNRG